jgi:hypothetical protein
MSSGRQPAVLAAGAARAYRQAYITRIRGWVSRSGRATGLPPVVYCGPCVAARPSATAVGHALAMLRTEVAMLRRFHGAYVAGCARGLRAATVSSLIC